MFNDFLYIIAKTFAFRSNGFRFGIQFYFAWMIKKYKLIA